MKKCLGKLEENSGKVNVGLGRAPVRTKDCTAGRRDSRWALQPQATEVAPVHSATAHPQEAFNLCALTNIFQG